jgi:histidinol phosphatase-like enzyme (inositol monophosphatase family)
MNAAAELATLAGEVALRHYQRALTIEIKRDGSPVTAADREAETAARAWIEARFPGDGILGEESGLTREDAPRRWILDPIDGTRTFVRGVPLWGTLVAVMEGEEVLAGAARFPALDELLVAARGEGCHWNGARCRVSEVAALEDAAVVTTDERFGARVAQRAAWARLASVAQSCRTWGDAYGYLLVATGRAEVMADGVLAVWDAAPVMPLIEEAGGVFTDWSGRRTPLGSSAIATNRGVAEAARAILSPRHDPPRVAG